MAAFPNMTVSKREADGLGFAAVSDLFAAFMWTTPERAGSVPLRFISSDVLNWTNLFEGSYFMHLRHLAALNAFTL